MTLSLKSIFVAVLAILHLNAFPQEPLASSLYSDGVAQLAKDQDKGFEVLLQAAKLSEQQRDRATQIQSLTALVSLDYYDRDEQARQVLDLLRQSESVLAREQPTEDLARFYVESAKFYEGFKQHTTKAIAYFNKAKQTWAALRGTNDAEVAACYHSLGDIYKYTTFDFYSAEKAYETALAIRTRIGFKDPVVLYRN